MPRVTVVVPTYKHHQYIEQCVGSIMLNSIKYDEGAKIVVVPVIDDSETYERILWLYHDYPVLEDVMDVEMCEKADVIHQMQVGLTAVKTDYVTFFGSDDFMLPSKLRTQVRLADEVVGRGNTPIINPTLVHTDADLTPVMWETPQPFAMYGMLKGCLLTEAALTETEKLKAIGGFCDPKVDWGYLSVYAMWLRLLKAYECEVVMTNPLALYRQLPTSVARPTNAAAALIGWPTS